MKGNVINLNTLHLNSVRLNGIGKVQSVSLKGGSTEDPVSPPVEPPIEPEPTPTYTLSASVTNGMVSATRNGSAVNLPYTANEGDTIVVEVTPNDGYTFEGWADGNTDNPRTITMNADVALSAQCVEVVQPPVGNYIQFEDKAVEEICVANWSSDGIGLTEEDAAKVTTIGATFRENTEITSFDEFRYFTGVTFIGTSDTQTSGGAFRGCTSLRSIRIPSSVKRLKPAAFANCSSLSSVGDLSHIEWIDFYAFSKCPIEGELNLSGLTNATIGYNAFNESKITKVLSLGATTILGGSTPIGTAAFGKCEYLEEINLEGVEVFQTGALSYCHSLRKIIAPSATDVQVYAFYECTAAEVIDLGVGLTNIGGYAFQKCTSLQKFIVRATTPPTLGNVNAFTNTNNCPIYVPDASLEAYRTATNWVSYADRIHPLSEIEGSPYIQFEDAEAERVLMANGVSSDGIGITKEDAAAVTSISTWFKGNTAITSFNELKYFTGVTELPSSAMQNCSALVSVNLDNIQYLRGSSLNNTGIDKVYLPSVKTISGSALSSGKYSVILLGKNLTNIENYAIRINSVLHTAICLATTPPTFGSGNFTSVNALISVYVPDASVETYKTASGWSGVASKFKALSQLATDNPSLYSEIEKYL